MEFHLENKTLLYFAVIAISSVSILLGKSAVFQQQFIAKKNIFRGIVLHALGLFSGIFFGIILIIFPFVEQFFWLPIALFVILSAITFIKSFPNKVLTSKEYFAEQISPMVKVVFAAMFILFFGIVQSSALMALGNIVFEKLFGGTSNLLLTISAVLAGLVVLVGGSFSVVVNNALMGFLVIVFSMLLIINPSVLVNLVSILFSDVSNFGIRQIDNNVFTQINALVVVLGTLLLIWWMWWVDNSAFRQQSGERKNIEIGGIRYSVLFLLAGALLFLFLKTRGNVQNAAIENLQYGYIFVLVFLLILFSGIVRSFYLVKVFSSYFISTGNFNKIVSEKEILAGRLAVAAAAIINILLFPLLKMAGVSLLLFNLVFVSSFVAPIISIFILFVVWKRLTKQGITVGVFSAIGIGFLNFIVSMQYSDTVFSVFVNPALFVVIASFFSVVISVGYTIFFDFVKMRRKKMVERLAAEFQQKL